MALAICPTSVESAFINIKVKLSGAACGHFSGLNLDLNNLLMI